MSQCPNKRWRTYRDPYSGDSRRVQYPCGHCACCLHNFQADWRVRVCETLYKYSEFIYDTLTIRDDSMLYIDARDEMEDELLPDEARKLLEHYDYQIPFFPKKLVSAWIKRGRELWNYDHREDIKAGRCTRLKIKYFGCHEYGPTTSRPHIHLIVVGISREDYLKYFARPWRNDYGFTATRFIHQDGKSVRNIAKYISKYVSKGNFESSLVKTGNQPGSFRIISHGVGEEYICSSRMRPLFECSDFTLPRRLSYRSEGKQDLPSNEDLLCAWSFVNDFTMSEDMQSRLLKYYDENGYCYNCPRYYRDKFTKAYNHTYLSAAVSRCLYEALELHRNQEVYEYATVIGITPRYKPESPSFESWLFTREGAMVFELFAAHKKRKAQMECKRRKIELANHYKRPKHAKKGVFTHLTI